jgi:hypothetical protein
MQAPSKEIQPSSSGAQASDVFGHYSRNLQRLSISPFAPYLCHNGAQHLHEALKEARKVKVPIATRRDMSGALTSPHPAMINDQFFSSN